MSISVCLAGTCRDHFGATAPGGVGIFWDEHCDLAGISASVVRQGLVSGGLRIASDFGVCLFLFYSVGHNPDVLYNPSLSKFLKYLSALRIALASSDFLLSESSGAASRISFIVPFNSSTITSRHH